MRLKAVFLVSLLQLLPMTAMAEVEKVKILGHSPFTWKMIGSVVRTTITQTD